MMRKISLISEYLIIPLYIGKKNTHTPNTTKLITTAGKNLITLGSTNNTCLIKKNEKRKEIVINIKSQENMIQRGAYLFLKNLSSIKDKLGV